ncbi:MAG TPA: 2-dehydropantoate 2-reductase [Candidatus Dormibacteraeota bacterium]|nr:2-dehydropantoate 2-reductase [Candidatus Dormibacteraeota bacterium]
MEPEALRVAVLGPGGVGGLLAALLTRAGNSVVVLAGESTARAITERGIRVESQRFGNFQVRPDAAVRLEGHVDACLITVKATQLHEALERVPANVVGDALVVPFLNGIDHVDLLRRTFPSENVTGATIRIEVARIEPGLVHHTSQFAAVEISTSVGRPERVERLASQLRATGLDVRVRDDETAMLWDKLVLLAPIALLTTHERANVGVVRTRRHDDAVAAISEVAATARAEGAAIDTEAVLQIFDSIPDSMESSMQRDQAAGRPLELDAIGGTVVRRAARAGVPVPVTARLVEELRQRK